MQFEELEIGGVFLIDLNPLNDSRGFFMRTYDANFFEARGLNTNWVHENHSTSLHKGTIRGLHFQFPPYSETKLVRVVSGSVQDFFIDIRKNSETFGKWGSVELSSKNKRCLYLPKGIAHGMCALENNTTMVYKVDSVYAPEYECQINWKDPILNINWPKFDKIVISSQDENAMSFKEFLDIHGGIEL